MNYQYKNPKPTPQKWWYVLIAVFCIIGGIGNIGESGGAAFFGIAVGLVMLYFTYKSFSFDTSVPQNSSNFENTGLTSSQYSSGIQNLLNSLSPYPDQVWVDLIFTPGTPARKIKKSLLKNLTQERVNNCHRIMKDCIRIMKETNNPDTYFSRYNLFDEQLAFLVSIEKYYNFKTYSPTLFQQQAEDARYETVELFLRIKYNELFDFVSGTSTVRVKINRIKKYLEMLEKYVAQIPEKALEEYRAKCQHMILDLNVNKI